MTRDQLAAWMLSRTEVDSAIMGGERVFRGTRLTVREISARSRIDPVAVILDDYPYLTESDIIAARELHTYE